MAIDQIESPVSRCLEWRNFVKTSRPGWSCRNLRSRVSLEVLCVLNTFIDSVVAGIDVGGREMRRGDEWLVSVAQVGNRPQALVQLCLILCFSFVPGTGEYLMRMQFASQCARMFAHHSSHQAIKALESQPF
jgi:hypothetical protein